MIARQGTRFQTLVDVRGSKTAAGAYYEAHTGLGLSVGGFDTSQAPFREGDTEYITMRNGQHRITRKWSPVDGEYKFT